MDRFLTRVADDRLVAPTQVESHRHIKLTGSEIELRPDGRVIIVTVLYTDLELSTLNPNYDANAVEELIARIQTVQKTHHQLIRLRAIK